MKSKKELQAIRRKILSNMKGEKSVVLREILEIKLFQVERLLESCQQEKNPEEVYRGENYSYGSELYDYYTRKPQTRMG